MRKRVADKKANIDDEDSQYSDESESWGKDWKGDAAWTSDYKGSSHQEEKPWPSQEKPRRARPPRKPGEKRRGKPCPERDAKHKGKILLVQQAASWSTAHSLSVCVC